MNADMVLPYLEDVEWDLHPGELATYGDWPVETREEFTFAAKLVCQILEKHARVVNITVSSCLVGESQDFSRLGKSVENLELCVRQMPILKCT